METYIEVKITSIISIAFVILVGLGTHSCTDTKQQIVNAIELGASPIEARCAISGNNSEALCTLLVSQKENCNDE